MILAGRGLWSKSNLHFSTENVSTPPCACKLISRKSGESRRQRSGASKRMTLGNPAAAGADDYDRLKEVKEFDDSKIGVRGLVESGAATIPRFFHHPPENLSLNRPPAALSVPTVDLSDLETDRRSAIVRQIADASRTWGFFQITNHGIPLSVIDDAISAVRSFHEQPLAVRSKYYTRGSGRGFDGVVGRRARIGEREVEGDDVFGGEGGGGALLSLLPGAGSDAGDWVACGSGRADGAGAERDWRAAGEAWGRLGGGEAAARGARHQHRRSSSGDRLLLTVENFFLCCVAVD